MSIRGYLIWLVPLLIFLAVLWAIPGQQPWWTIVPVAFVLSLFFHRLGKRVDR
jgi:hypothetical protein